MAIFYCDVQYPGNQFSPGVYAIDGKKTNYFQYMMLSNRAWIEDDNGVRWAKNREKDVRDFPALDKNELKEFVWAKLKAQFIT